MSTQPPLTEAERLAYAEIYAGAHNADHSMVGLKPGAVCPRCEATARAVVAAVRPVLAAEFRDDLFREAAELPGADEDDPEAEARAEAREAAADRLAALAPEQATPDAKDAFWRAAAITRSNPLPRPTSKETDR